ncbi:MAG: YicC family protein [Holophagaceae bacterium]|nr:YicC family protein [Holophagaceae bacterium]
MKSMTAFAEIVRPLEAGQLRLTLRSVNSKSMDLSLRLPPALFPLEAGLRAKVRGAAQRGKLDLTVEVQDEPSLEPHMNRALLRAVAKGWQEDAEWLNLPPLTAEAFFRLPGAFQSPATDLGERLEAPVREALDALLEVWNEGRSREADRLRPFFEDGLARLKALKDRLQAEATLQAAELPGLYRQRIEQLLDDARLAGQLPAERLLAEAGVLAERQDVREELIRLSAHLDDFAERLARGRLEGKAVDVWCQEVLRELNTTGSKCKRLDMTRAVMEAKGVLDQIREQSANLE